MQRTENKLSPKQKKNNGKLKAGLENFTEHRKRHYENRQKEDKYRITSPRVSGGMSLLWFHICFKWIGGSSAFSGAGGKAAGTGAGAGRSRKNLVRHGKLVAVDRLASRK